jgi:hypothetical protein
MARDGQVLVRLAGQTKLQPEAECSPACERVGWSDARADLWLSVEGVLERRQVRADKVASLMCDERDGFGFDYLDGDGIQALGSGQGVSRC